MLNKVNGYDLIVPVYNEKNILKLLNYVEENTEKLNKIYICYDFEEDITLNIINNSKYKNSEKIVLTKNPFIGPCEAVKEGIKHSISKSVIVYPADDFDNAVLLDEMYDLFKEGYDIVCPSRFMQGGSMKNCPFIKFLLVKLVSLSLFYFSKINIHDPTNGFRFFSKELIDKLKIESKYGFAYSIELLVKAKKNNYKITEIPAKWIERDDRKSSFKILKWSRQYLKWFFYAILN